MQEIKNQLAKLISDLLKLDVKETEFTDTPNSEVGDLALPLFRYAKELKKNPKELADQIISQVKSEIVSKVEFSGGYLNFFIKTEYLNKIVLEQDLSIPRQAQDDKSKIMIEYSQPNTHKEFHVGHLRNACLGASLVNMYRYLGSEVISANYIGDAGVHIAKCLWGLKRYHEKDDIPENKGAYLGEIYTRAVRELEANSDLMDEVSDIQKTLERGDKELVELWQETKKWSLDNFYRIYNLLNIKFDQWFWESEEEKVGRKVVEKLIKENKVKEIKASEGAIIADLREYNLEVLVLIKSDGNVLYGTKDLPLGKKKFDEFGIDKSIYVVDNRQSLYMKQIFKLLDLIGYENKTKIHVPYDFVTLPEGAMASRKGNVVTFEDFYNEIFEKAKDETEKRHLDWSESKIRLVAEKVSLSAIKFNMLKYDNNSVIVFDVNKALSFDGDTGPYLLYTLARINSIINKIPNLTFEMIKDNYGLLSDRWEHDLILQLAKFEEVVQKSAENYSPIILCTYLLEIAQLYNNFYHNCPVIKAEANLQQARLVLSKKTKDCLEKGLNLLNIDILQEM